jgi:hypothetical protein
VLYRLFAQGSEHNRKTLRIVFNGNNNSDLLTRRLVIRIISHGLQGSRGVIGIHGLRVFRLIQIRLCVQLCVFWTVSFLLPQRIDNDPA